MNEERSAEKRKLNILILSCSTGGGHNAAGRAMEEYFRQQGQIASGLSGICRTEGVRYGRKNLCKDGAESTTGIWDGLPAGRCSKPACETFPGILCKFHDGGISG